MSANEFCVRSQNLERDLEELKHKRGLLAHEEQVLNFALVFHPKSTDQDFEGRPDTWYYYLSQFIQHQQAALSQDSLLLADLQTALAGIRAYLQTGGQLPLPQPPYSPSLDY